jgi:hypothetical protein
MPHEALALIAEVERLREFRNNALHAATDEMAEERAAVVAWLRGDAGFCQVPGNMAYCDFYADFIERGEHRREEVK